jgi:hypothetical protein
MMIWNEDEEHRESERLLIHRINRGSKYLEFVKIPIRGDGKSSLDFAIISKTEKYSGQPKLLGMAELKVRNCQMNRFDTLMIDLQKWMAMTEYLRSWIPVFLIVRWSDCEGFYFQQYEPRPHYSGEGPDYCHERTLGGRRDRGQIHDIDIVTHIPIKDFVKGSSVSNEANYEMEISCHDIQENLNIRNSNIRELEYLDTTPRRP